MEIKRKKLNSTDSSVRKRCDQCSMFIETDFKKTSMCRKCHRSYTKNHYQKNKKYYIRKAKSWNKGRAAFVQSLKSKPCMDCGKKYPYYVMDFDHKFDKKFSITGSNRYMALERLLEEIAKCDLVCANCHRERSYRRLNGIPLREF